MRDQRDSLRVASLLAIVSTFALLPAPVLAAWPRDPSSSVPICRASGNQYYLVSAGDGVGGAYFAWRDERGGSNHPRVYAQYIDLEGTPLWGDSGIAVSTASGNQDMPRLVSDGADGVIVVWRDFGADTAGDLRAQFLNGSGAPEWGTGGVPVSAVPLIHARSHVATSDGRGGAIVAWQDDRDPNNDHIYAQRVDLQGTAKWAADGVPVCPVSSFQATPVIDVDGSGGPIIAWQDNRGGTYFAGFAQRLDANGAPLWTTNGVLLCTSTAGQWGIAAAGDGSGGAAFAWMDNRSLNGWQQIFAQRVDATGAVRWAADGVSLSGTALAYFTPWVLSTGAAGAITLWSSDNGGVGRTRAQRVSATGDPQWSAGGVPVGSGDDGGGWYGIATVSDGAGGLLCAWNPFNGVSFEIRAQRIGPDGTAMWDPSGVLLCSAPNRRFGTTLVEDGTHGAIAGWVDLRNGTDYDLYAEQVNGLGRLSVPASLPAGAFLAPPSPSPSRGGQGVTFRLQSPGPGTIRIEMYDAAGRLVRALATRVGAAGPVELRWDGRDAEGRTVRPGLYFVRAQAAERSAAAKFVIAQ